MTGPYQTNTHSCMQLTEPPFSPMVPAHSSYMSCDGQQYQCKFSLAAVNRPLLGNDFIVLHIFIVSFIHFYSKLLRTVFHTFHHLPYSPLAPRRKPFWPSQHPYTTVQGLRACPDSVPGNHHSNVLHRVSEAWSISPHHHHRESGTLLCSPPPTG